MSDHRVKIPRASDKTVVAAFKELLDEFQTLNTQGLTGMAFAGVSLPPFRPGHQDPSAEWAEVLSADGYVIDHVATALESMNVYFYRGGVEAPRSSPVYDELRFTYPDNGTPPSPAQRLMIAQRFSRAFNALENDRILTAAPEVSAQVVAIHEDILNRLERTNQNLIEQQVAYRQRTDEENLARRAKLEQEAADKRALLDEEHQLRVKELREREDALLARVRAIDDRDNTHVRRAIRDRMLEDVKARVEAFGVSAATSKKRNPVAVLMTVLCLLLAGACAWTLWEIAQVQNERDNLLGALRAGVATKGQLNDEQKNAVATLATAISERVADRTSTFLLWARFALLFTGLIAALLFFIRWLRAWADQHAQQEFELLQFQIDVNRANWVLESCLEWLRSSASPIPPEVLTSFTKHLFSRDSKDETQVLHPADELARALLGSSSRLKLKISDNELEFNKPGKIDNKGRVVGKAPDAEAA